MTVVVKKLGGSVAVMIPKGMARELELAEGTLLSILANSESIVLRKQEKRARRRLSKIVADINPESYKRRGREWSNDGPVGKEIW
ncbi:MAG TPA: AbrB/MazE/SpoVT family DNA-binding domain-containing protein [Tepidisphaeraceae bacterium]|nr:AbrB/MazE/SpoVT family DNA-binding domain-containing protein [Tepidisphaeraceae bacterium]